MDKESGAFSVSLNEDRSRLKLTSRLGEAELSAADVVELLGTLAELRAQMVPPVPDTSSGSPLLEGDRFEAYRDNETGTAQVYFRVPGLAWTYVTFSKEHCEQLAETIAGPRPPPEGSPQH